MSNYRFLIDNGHSGLVNGIYVTPGKRSPVWPDGRQLFEGVFNRMVVRQLAPLCQNAGIQHTIIVPEEEDISLAERVRRANQIASTGRCIYVSVHANAGGGTGWEIWTTVGQTKSDIIADIFVNVAKQFFPTFPMRGKKEANFYVLRNTICPAVLTENFFMDRLHPDCEFLMSPEGVTAVAQMHFTAIQQIETIKPI